MPLSKQVADQHEQGPPRPDAGGTRPLTPCRLWLLAPAAAAAAFLILTLHAGWRETPTVDEFSHVPAGCAYLTHGRLDLYAKNPPLFKMLLALPVLIGGAEVPTPPEDAGGWNTLRFSRAFMAANAGRYLGLVFAARLVVIIAGLLTALMLFRWARQLFGLPPAAVVTTLFLLSPTVLAHSHLATIDAACMLSLLCALLALRWALSVPGYARDLSVPGYARDLSVPGCARDLRQPAWWRVALAGAAWGAALLIKFTALLLLPALLLLIIVRCGRAYRRLALVTALLLASALVVVNLGMGFAGSLRALGSYRFGSQLGRGVQSALPAWLPVPLPEAYVLGFDAQKLDTEQGEFGSFLLGSWTEQSPWYHFLVVLALKTPLPLLLMIVVALWRLRGVGLPRDELAAIAGPALTLLLFMVLFNRLHGGVRYLLPAFPFLFMLLGALWRVVDRPLGRVAAAAAVAYYAITAAVVHPEYIGYFNLAAGGSGGGHRLLLDSNLDWGQDLYRVKAEVKKLGHQGPVPLLYFGHVDPRLYGLKTTLVPPEPIEGLLAVSVNFVKGYPYVAWAPEGRMVRVGPSYLKWLRGQEPVARAGSIWIYDTRSRSGSSGRR